MSVFFTDEQLATMTEVEPGTAKVLSQGWKVITAEYFRGTI